MRILDSVARLQAGLDYHLARHNLLVANLAHVDTPDFHPLDLERTSPAAFSSTLATEMAKTSDGHLGGASANGAAAAPPAWHVVQDPGASPGLDGNGVSVDREAVKIATNHMRYETLATLTTSELSGLVWAVNDGRTG
jgi:flagellar basal-body rod protein FlgB